MWLDDDWEDPAPVVEAAPKAPVATDAELVVQRAALRDALDRLRTGEDAFYVKSGVWLDCGTEAAARQRMDRGVTPWETDGCWTALGFAPTPLAGGLWVTVDARGYRIHALLDTDHDGVPIEGLATRDLPAVLTTPTSIR